MEGADPNGATDLTDGNKFEPGASATSRRDGVRDAFTTAQERVVSAVEAIGDTLRQIAGQGTGAKPGVTNTGGSDTGNGDSGNSAPDGASGGAGAGG